jgi:hypothetical protein
MTTCFDRIAPGAVQAAPTFWASRREVALNWLALGLLLAAWNASDNDASAGRPRPHTLRGYSYVSVRAAHRAGSVPTS